MRCTILATGKAVLWPAGFISFNIANLKGFFLLFRIFISKLHICSCYPGPSMALIRVQLCGDCGGGSLYLSPQHASYSRHGLHAAFGTALYNGSAIYKVVWRRFVCIGDVPKPDQSDKEYDKRPTRLWQKILRFCNILSTRSACLHMNCWLWQN